jgi:hypothetical protein
MLKRVLVTSAVLIVAALPAAAQATDDLAQREQQVWEAVQKKQLDKFAAALDTGFVGVYSDGIHNRDTEIETIRQGNLRSFRLSDFSGRRLDGRTTLVTYKVDIQADAGGTDLSGTYWASSLWRNTGGKWRTVMHTEVRAS